MESASKNEDHEKLLFKFSEPVSEALKKINKILWTIISVLVLAVITMLLMVCCLVIDAWRWKANSYNEMVRVMDAKNQELQKERFNETERQLNNIQESVNQIPTSFEKQDAGMISD